jgi:hypothetical protein
MRDRSAGSKVFRAITATTALLALLSLQGCLTYSSFQSARIVERGHPHATLGISRSMHQGDKDRNISWWTLDGDMRFGIAKNIDGSVRMSVFHNLPEGRGGSQITLDIRAGIIRDHLAAVLPATVTLGDFYMYSLRLQPGLVATLPLSDRFEITGSARAHVYVRVMELFGTGYTLGMGMTNGTGEWTIRPEVGWLRLASQNSGTTYFQYGVGIEHNFLVER